MEDKAKSLKQGEELFERLKVERSLPVEQADLYHLAAFIKSKRASENSREASASDDRYVMHLPIIIRRRLTPLLKS